LKTERLFFLQIYKTHLIIHHLQLIYVLSEQTKVSSNKLQNVFYDYINSELVRICWMNILNSKIVEKQYAHFSVKSDKMIAFRHFYLRTFFNTFTGGLVFVKIWPKNVFFGSVAYIHLTKSMHTFSKSTHTFGQEYVYFW